MITDDVAEELEKLWKEILKENGKGGKQSRTSTTNRPPAFGEIEGCPEGSEFESRQDLTNSYLHRPPQAGIWGAAARGRTYRSFRWLCG